MALSRTRRTTIIQPPKNCPSCSSVLTVVNDQLFCKNEGCPGRSSQKLQHFCKTMKIKGLGPKTIEKLDLVSIADIYSLDRSNLVNKLGSEKTADKLVTEIEYSKSHPLEVVLPAFGIPLVGTSASNKLALVCDSIFDIDAKNCKRSGIGPAASSNLLDWIGDNFDLISELPFSFEFSSNNATTPKKIVCISGKLKSYSTKAEAAKVLERHNYQVKPRITKDVQILVNEEGRESEKTRKARDAGLTIITDIKQLIGE